MIIFVYASVFNSARSYRQRGAQGLNNIETTILAVIYDATGINEQYLVTSEYINVYQ